MKQLKGYRTIIVNLVGMSALILDYLNSFPFSSFIDDKHKLLIYTLGFGVANLVLRSITTTPIGKKTNVSNP